MYNASLYTKFFWVDDFYMTGLLARAVDGVSYESFNSVYIVNTNFVEERFTGKQSEYTVFGHLPEKLNTLYRVWKKILKKQFQNNPKLFSTHAEVVQKNDFSYIKNFKWPIDFWVPYLNNHSTEIPLYDF
jgi:hypothetical protein